MRKLNKIYWVKQKLVGLLLLILSIVCFDLFIANEAGLLLVIAFSMGLGLLLTKKKLFVSDYIIEFNKNLL